MAKLNHAGKASSGRNKGQDNRRSFFDSLASNADTSGYASSGRSDADAAAVERNVSWYESIMDDCEAAGISLFDVERDDVPSDDDFTLHDVPSWSEFPSDDYDILETCRLIDACDRTAEIVARNSGGRYQGPLYYIRELDEVG